MTASFIFVGTYTEAICTVRFNEETGELAGIGATPGPGNPSYLILNAERDRLYAVNELLEYQGEFGGAVSAYRVDRSTGELTLINTQPTHGSDPCHLCLDPNGRFLAVANYTSGQVTIFRVREDGGLATASQVVAHYGHSVDPQRQTGPHCHYVVFDRAGEHLHVADLGLDQIVVYKINPHNGALSPAGAPARAAPGAGPRQVVLHPTAPRAYVLNELASSINMHEVHPGSGGLAPSPTFSTLPAGFQGANAGAELQITRCGRFLYSSNRGHDSIAIFAIDASTGRLSALGHQSTQGANPRHFGLSPDERFLIVANQTSGNLVVMRRDKETGLLTPSGDSLAIERPVCVAFAGKP
jgi:6-phosphogluconolactonase